jgi:hypothetical protein
MATKKRSDRNPEPKMRLSKVILIVIILAAIAAIAAYYLTQKSGKTNDIRVPSASQLQWKEKKPQEMTQSKPMAKTALEGNWVSDTDGTMLDIQGNTFSIDSPSVDSHTYYQGMITVSGDKAQFVFKGKNAPCGHSSGNYTFQIKGDNLILKPAHDTCTIRKAKLAGNWSHL